MSPVLTVSVLGEDGKTTIAEVIRDALQARGFIVELTDDAPNPHPLNLRIASLQAKDLRITVRTQTSVEPRTRQYLALASEISDFTPESK